MAIPTEPIGSIPRPPDLLEAMAGFAEGSVTNEDLDGRFQAALEDTIERFEATGSPVITDGEQTKPSFATYPLDGVEGLAPDGVTIPFEDGHTRQLPRLTQGPFRYGAYADAYLAEATRIARVPVKQAVIAPSALSLLYPPDGIDGYPQDAFLADLADESEQDIRRCLDAGAYKVQLDFTEGRLSIKLDPSKGILGSFVQLINTVLDRFTDEERSRIGIHTCPGGDQDSTHSLDVDYAELLPSLFQLHAGSFYVQLASESDPDRVLGIIREHAPESATVFVGVIDPIDPRVESADEVRDRVLRAAEILGLDRLGTCDDCGFSPFGDDTSTSRDTAFAKIAARVEGTAAAAERLGA
ncbi:MAG TPA: cobalamin-independent methionine synthase II family protein [Thermoleophilaceae bacterium]|jgi:5-methyltetrahydropteroyltriglutamate--homocysteine methyltransferase